MKTQNERLLKHLKSGKTIDGIRSWHLLGIYRLASRIHDLRTEGWNIKDQWVEGKNRYGEDTRWKEYYL